jgi:hypothetical protein
MKFYRYRIEIGDIGGFDEFENFVRASWDNVSVVLAEYSLLKETPKGYWITDTWGVWKKWISKTSRKRFAYPTKEEALNSFRIRTTRRATYLERDLTNVKKALEIVKTIEL